MQMNILRRLDLVGAALSAAREGLSPTEDRTLLAAARRLVKELDGVAKKRPQSVRLASRDAVAVNGYKN